MTSAASTVTGALRVNPIATKVGVVAIGRNEGPRLKLCLESLLRQSAFVVYADSGSTDGSADLALAAGVEVVVLPDDGRLSAAAGRAAGFRRLRSLHPEIELVQFVDGDCILEAGWLATAVSYLGARPRAAVVCGQRREAFPERSLYNALCDAEWNTPIGIAEACGGDALFRVEAYEQAGGFRAELLAGEEPELCGRLRGLGWEVWRIDANMTEHDARMLHFGQWWRRSRRGGYGYAQVWIATRTPGPPLYARPLASAVEWALMLPLAVVAVALIAGPIIFAAIPLAYALQTARIYRRFRTTRSRPFTQTAMTMLAKIPETLGALAYLFRAARPAA